jgi:sterol 3beta-glucosyltransferase
MRLDKLEAGTQFAKNRTMKISLFTLGTTGDVEPVIALAKRLQKEGHQIQACSVDLHEKRFKRLGLDFVCVGESGIQLSNMDESFDRLLRSSNPFYQFGVIADLLLHKAGDRHAKCRKALETTELAICHIIDTVAIAAVMDCRVPWISMRFDTMGIATSSLSPFLINFGGWINRLLWKSGEWLLSLKVNRILRERLPCSVERHPSLKMFRTYSPHLNLIAVSPEVSSIPHDLPRSFQVTGPWVLEDPEFKPSVTLASFLNAHSRPAVVGFGSVAGSGLPPLIAMSVAALRGRGVPAIVQNSRTLHDTMESPDLLSAGYVPHGFLLKGARFLIHHGGAGTSTAAVREGVPSIVIPHNSDQFYGAQRLCELGVAPKPLKRAKVTRERLEALIKDVEENPGYQARASELKAKLRREDGLGTAARVIHQFAVTLQSR